MVAVLGAILYRSLHISLLAIGMISALTSAFFFIYFLDRKALRTGLLIAIALFLGAWRMSFDTEHVPQELFSQKNITGTVQSVDRRLDKTLVSVTDYAFHKTIQVSIQSKVSALPGDTVSVYGQIEKPKDFQTDTGRTFEYQNYLKSKGIVGLVSNGSMHVVSLGHFSLSRFATVVRFHIADILSAHVSFPIDGIASGMLVGYQGSLPDSLQDLFRTTGVLHVLVLSGENITLLATFIGVLLKRVPYKIRIALTGIAIILIVLVSGSGVAAVRSGIMGTIALSAGLLRRGYVPLRALTISALFFFCYSPSTLFIDPGFHLSMLATIFMILVLPKAKKLFSFIPETYGLQETVILAICMPLFMLPYTMYFSGIEPVASPFANILMTVLVPTIMLLGIGVLAVSWIRPLALMLGGLLSFVGRVTMQLLELCNGLPQLNTPPVAWWGVVVTYAVFFIVLLRKELRLRSSSFVP